VWRSVHNCSVSLTVVSLCPDISMTVRRIGVLCYMDALMDLIKDVPVAKAACKANGGLTEAQNRDEKVAELEPRAPE
jgi:hypothetical protein